MGAQLVPSRERGEPLVGNPVNLGIQIAEVLSCHRSRLHSRRDALRDDRELEMGQRDVSRQVAEVGAGPGGIAVSQVGAGREAGQLARRGSQDRDGLPAFPPVEQQQAKIAGTGTEVAASAR